MIYRFDDYALDTESLELRRGDEAVPVEPQVFSLLAHLIENRDRVVSKDELIEVISRHIEIDAAAVKIEMAKDGRQQRLVADIPVLGPRRRRR